jgi:hypothetical protein
VGRAASGQPDFITSGSAIDPLQDELEIEAQLEFTDHDDRRVSTSAQIAASDFAFDDEAEPFEEGLDRPIERRLQNRSPVRPGGSSCPRRVLVAGRAARDRSRSPGSRRPPDGWLGMVVHEVGCGIELRNL